MHVDDFESQQQRRSSRNMVSPPGGVRGPGFSSRLLLRVQLKGLGLRFDGDGWRAVVELLQTGWDRRGCCEVDWAVCRDDKALPSCSLLGTAWHSVSQGQRQMKHHCLPCHTHTHTHTPVFFYVLDPWRCLATKPHIAVFFGDDPKYSKKTCFWRQGPSPQLNMATQRHSTVIRLLLLPFVPLGPVPVLLHYPHPPGGKTRLVISRA